MAMTIEIPEGYESLGLALGEAVAQASHGKGAERHAGAGEKFSDQLIMSIPKRLGEGGECFCLGQAAKKIFESRRLPPDRARAELLGAVNYLAAAWCLLGGMEGTLKERASRLIARNGTVSAPESDAPRTKEELFGRIRDCSPAVYGPAPEEREEPLRFEPGGPVEYEAPDGSWKSARFVRVLDGAFVLSAGGAEFRAPFGKVRKA